MSNQLIHAEQAAYLAVQEIVYRGADVLYDHYIEDRSYPFAVQQIMANIDNTMEAVYMRHDTGESTKYPVESEPQPAKIDTWARSAVPIKRKIKILPSPEPAAIPADNRSMRSFRSSRSGISRMTASAMQRSVKNFNPSTTIDEGKPQAVALELSMEEVTEEEEVLRVEKEKELKRRKEEQDRQLRIKQEEEEKERMLIKKAEELRNKPFTYDHNGGIMIINPPRFEKLPNPSLSANFQIPEDNEENVKKPPTRRRVQAKQEVQPPKARKQAPQSETEWVKNITSVQPPIFDSIKLTNGVVLQEGNRVKQPPKTAAPRTMTRKDYRQMLQDSQPRENSQQSSQRSLKKVVSEGTFDKNFASNKVLIDNIPDYEFQLGSQPRKDSPKQQVSKGPLLNKITAYGEDEFEDTTNLNVIEKFNSQIKKSSNWGQNPPLKNPMLPKRMPARPDQRQVWTTHGNRVHKPSDKPFMQVNELITEKRMKKPRDRPFVETKEQKRHRPAPPFGQTVKS